MLGGLQIPKNQEFLPIFTYFTNPQMRFAFHQAFRVILFTLSLVILSPLFCYSSEGTVTAADNSNYSQAKQGIQVSFLMYGPETNDNDERTVYFPNYVLVQRSPANDYLWIFRSHAIISPALLIRSLYRLYSAMLI